MTFDEVMRAWDWKPIRNCPGRYVLRGGARPDLLPGEIIAGEFETKEFKVETARDTVLVIEFDGGGLISYRHADGSFLHTLNTVEGFERKLSQLGIDLS
ncbi:MAG TPA: hypothetical protein VF791_17505 [Pyrinomonadaceae bacterium]